MKCPLCGGKLEHKDWSVWDIQCKCGYYEVMDFKDINKIGIKGIVDFDLTKVRKSCGEYIGDLFFITDYNIQKASK